MNTPLAQAGVYEFIFGAHQDKREELLRFWEVLGFRPAHEGGFTAGEAAAFYGHEADLVSIRLQHPGCETFGTGMVRLQLWSELRNPGLGKVRPIQPGSRWMGMYTQDILQLRDSFESERSRKDWNLWISPLVNAPLAKPAPVHDFYRPFVGLRETLVFGDDFRLAFIQRAGFDRPGFGTYDSSAPFKNTEGSHANIVQPDNSFSTDFYKTVLDFEPAPFGEAHDSGDEAPTIAALDLRPGELFRVERTRAPECPSGLLQVYSSYQPDEDFRDLSRAGSGNLCLYSVRVTDIAELAVRVERHGGVLRSGPSPDEFGQASLYFDAPDGYSWVAVANVG
jgi:hypothetical protein